MAFKKKNINEIFGLVVLVLLGLSPSVSSVDCNGKSFHCVNSTHFRICVDLGGGVSQTVDDFLIPCPPPTVCQGNNHFECEFPVPPASSTTENNVINKITPPWEDITVTTISPIQNTTIEYSEKYMNTESITTLSAESVTTENAVFATDFFSEYHNKSSNIDSLDFVTIESTLYETTTVSEQSPQSELENNSTIDIVDVATVIPSVLSDNQIDTTESSLPPQDNIRTISPIDASTMSEGMFEDNSFTTAAYESATEIILPSTNINTKENKDQLWNIDTESIITSTTTETVKNTSYENIDRTITPHLSGESAENYIQTNTQNGINENNSETITLTTEPTRIITRNRSFIDYPIEEPAYTNTNAFISQVHTTDVTSVQVTVTNEDDLTPTTVSGMDEITATEMFTVSDAHKGNTDSVNPVYESITETIVTTAESILPDISSLDNLIIGSIKNSVATEITTETSIPDISTYNNIYITEIEPDIVKTEPLISNSADGTEKSVYLTPGFGYIGEALTTTTVMETFHNDGHAYFVTESAIEIAASDITDGNIYFSEPNIEMANKELILADKKLSATQPVNPEHGSEFIRETSVTPTSKSYEKVANNLVDDVFTTTPKTEMATSHLTIDSVNNPKELNIDKTNNESMLADSEIGIDQSVKSTINDIAFNEGSTTPSLVLLTDFQIQSINKNLFLSTISVEATPSGIEQEKVTEMTTVKSQVSSSYANQHTSDLADQSSHFVTEPNTASIKVTSQSAPDIKINVFNDTLSWTPSTAILEQSHGIENILGHFDNLTALNKISPTELYEFPESSTLSNNLFNGQGKKKNVATTFPDYSVSNVDSVASHQTIYQMPKSTENNFKIKNDNLTNDGGILITTDDKTLLDGNNNILYHETSTVANDVDLDFMTEPIYKDTIYVDRDGYDVTGSGITSKQGDGYLKSTTTHGIRVEDQTLTTEKHQPGYISSTLNIYQGIEKPKTTSKGEVTVKNNIDGDNYMSNSLSNILLDKLPHIENSNSSRVSLSKDIDDNIPNIPRPDEDLPEMNITEEFTNVEINSHVYSSVRIVDGIEVTTLYREVVKNNDEITKSLINKEITTHSPVTNFTNRTENTNGILTNEIPSTIGYNLISNSTSKVTDEVTVKILSSAFKDRTTDYEVTTEGIRFVIDKAITGETLNKVSQIDEKSLLDKSYNQVNIQQYTAGNKNAAKVTISNLHKINQESTMSTLPSKTEYSEKQNTKSGLLIESETTESLPGYASTSVTGQKYFPTSRASTLLSTTNGDYKENEPTSQLDTNMLKKPDNIINKTIPGTDTFVGNNRTESNIGIVTTTVNLPKNTGKQKTWNNAELNFTCRSRIRGRYADKEDCRKFYICVGNNYPIMGTCPINTVFSEINKQCTKNMAHCIRDNQFKCATEGRFTDFLSENIYYVCVKGGHDQLYRFKFQCENGFHLNKITVRCEENTQSFDISSQSISASSSHSTVKTFEKISEKINRNPQSSENSFECEDEGKYADSNDCRKFYVCTKTKKSQFRRRVKRCDSDELFHKSKKKCVDADSYEC